MDFSWVALKALCTFWYGACPGKFKWWLLLITECLLYVLLICLFTYQCMVLKHFKACWVWGEEHLIIKQFSFSCRRSEKQLSWDFKTSGFLNLFHTSAQLSAMEMSKKVCVCSSGVFSLWVSSVLFHPDVSVLWYGWKVHNIHLASKIHSLIWATHQLEC